MSGSTHVQSYHIMQPFMVLSLFSHQQQISFINDLQSGNHHLPLPISKASITQNGLLSIRLNRPAVFQKVIADVTEKGRRYGQVEPSDEGISEAVHHQVLLNSAPVCQDAPSSSSDSPGHDGLSLGELRGALFGAQLKNILEFMG